MATTLDGAVRALVGGVDYEESPFNRATQAYRQPGSAFKPIVYAAGVEAGLSGDSRMVDSPLQIAGWQPKNFTNRYLGEISLRQAMAQSINTVAVRVGEYAGRAHVIDVARRLGITADMQVTPSLALGVTGVSLIEMTGAYAGLANGGIGVWPYGIEAIYDARGRPLYTRDRLGPRPRALGRLCRRDHRHAGRAVESGTGRAARFGRPIAGKTGTSQNFRDAWFIGWSAELVAGVWMGNDDDQAMNGVTGGGLPAQLWRAFMADAHAGRPIRPLPSLGVPVPVTGADASGFRRRRRRRGGEAGVAGLLASAAAGLRRLSGCCRPRTSRPSVSAPERLDALRRWRSRDQRRYRAASDRPVDPVPPLPRSILPGAIALRISG